MPANLFIVVFKISFSSLTQITLVWQYCFSTEFFHLEFVWLGTFLSYHCNDKRTLNCWELIPPFAIPQFKRMLSCLAVLKIIIDMIISSKSSFVYSLSLFHFFSLDEWMNSIHHLRFDTVPQFYCRFLQFFFFIEQCDCFTVYYY